jgi:hypothetical protein
MRLSFGLLHVPQPRFMETVFQVSFFLEVDIFFVFAKVSVLCLKQRSERKRNAMKTVVFDFFIRKLLVRI